MTRLARLAVAALLALAAASGYAAEEALDARGTALAAELRCLVCQNQSIAESNAELAVDLRRQIREQIAAGRSDDQIRQYMVDRYGDFVLYRPPFQATTVLLWLGPLALLAIGFVVLRRALKARAAQPEAPALSPEEQARAAALLAARDDPR